MSGNREPGPRVLFAIVGGLTLLIGILIMVAVSVLQSHPQWLTR